MTAPVNDDLVRELGRELPYEPPSAGRREAVRASLLASLEHGEQAPVARAARWPRIAMLAGGALAAAAAIIVVLDRAAAVAPATTADRAPAIAPIPSAFDGQPDAHAIVAASAGAELEHTSRRTATGADEQVRVRAGHLRLAVAPLGNGDHVRLVTGDAQVVAAGVYEVTVARDSIRDLTVRTGGALLTVHGEQAVFLVAGQTWHAPTEIATIDLPVTAPPPPPPTPAAPTTPARTTPAPTTPAAAPHPTATRTAAEASPGAPHAVPAPTAPPPRTESAVERSFLAGWAAFRAGDFTRAAERLGAAADAGERTGDPIAIDARYQQAVALARAGHAGDAEHIVRAFLASNTSSPRRGRAQLLLGRLLAARGDRAGAAVELRAAARDADPEVATAARAALADAK